MLQRIRIFWLWLVSEYHAAKDLCDYCGRRGIESVSIAWPKRLCRDCGIQVQIDTTKGYRKVDVEEPTCAHGKTSQQECDKCQGGFDGCSPQVEDECSFDFYPYSIPRYLQREHSNNKDLENQ